MGYVRDRSVGVWEATAMRFRIRYGLLVALALTSGVATAGSRAAVHAYPLGGLGEYFGLSAYPDAALRAREQGRAVVSVDVDENGMPSACRVTTSSASQSLDRTTCEISMAKMRFMPALDRHRHRVADVYKFSIHWVLPDTNPNGERSIVTFGGTPDQITCSVATGRLIRQMAALECREVAASAVAKGYSLKEPVPLEIADPDARAPYPGVTAAPKQP